MSAPATARMGADVAEIRRALLAILQPGQVTELRALDAVTLGSSYRQRHTISGYFDYEHLDDLAKAAAGLDAKGIYIIPNPINAALIARAFNRVKDLGKNDPTTTDRDITRRTWLLIDADAVRPSGISSTDVEHDAALSRALEIRRYLTALGWTDPIYGDSGNGGHLLYAIDLSRDDGGLVGRVLKALAARFSDEGVEIDQGVCNPARIWKLYGTVAGKGDSIPDRPHRIARLLEVPPGELTPVSRELLERIAATAPHAPEPKTTNNGTFDPAKWIADHNIAISKDGPWGEGNYRWELAECLFDPSHRGSAYIVRMADGPIGAGCHHNSCGDKDWPAMRDIVEPGWRDRRNGTTRQKRKTQASANGPTTTANNGDAHTPQNFSTPPDIATVREVVFKNFPTVYRETLACLATMATLLLKANANPVALTLMGAPSSMKTTVLEFFADAPIAYKSDKFSPKSFVTHHAATKKEMLPEIDLLPRIRHKCMITPELAPLFRGKDDELTENFTILTRVLDGTGLTTDSGTQGRRGYTGDYLFSWLGASTPFHPKVWRIMAQLGSRLFFLAMSDEDATDEDLNGVIMAQVPYIERLRRCREVIGKFVEHLFGFHGGVRGVTWDTSTTPRPVLDALRNLARIVAHLRGLVSVYDDDAGGIGYTQANIEQPYRAMAILHNLACGHAILHGRDHLTTDDLPLVIEIALSSMPTARARLVQEAIRRRGTLTTAQAAAALRVTKPTAKKALIELSLLEVGTLFDDPSDLDGDRPTKLFTLGRKAKWLLSDDFKALTEGVGKEWGVCAEVSIQDAVEV